MPNDKARAKHIQSLKPRGPTISAWEDKERKLRDKFGLKLPRESRAAEKKRNATRAEKAKEEKEKEQKRRVEAYKKRRAADKKRAEKLAEANRVKKARERARSATPAGYTEIKKSEKRADMLERLAPFAPAGRNMAHGGIVTRPIDGRATKGLTKGSRRR